MERSQGVAWSSTQKHPGKWGGKQKENSGACCAQCAIYTNLPQVPSSPSWRLPAFPLALSHARHWLVWSLRRGRGEAARPRPAGGWGSRLSLSREGRSAQGYSVTHSEQGLVNFLLITHLSQNHSKNSALQEIWLKAAGPTGHPLFINLFPTLGWRGVRTTKSMSHIPLGSCN